MKTKFKGERSEKTPLSALISNCCYMWGKIMSLSVSICPLPKEVVMASVCFLSK